MSGQPAWADLLLDILRIRPAGINEYDLMCALRDAGHEDFAPAVFRDQLALFRAHFLLFHSLHHLRDDLIRRREATLDIHALRVILRPYREPDNAALAQHDPLRAYYLDLRNLSVTAVEIEALLERFWKRASALTARGRALAELELEDPVDDNAIKRQYRRLAMRHHPDRGGDNARLQAINAAMDVLAGGRASGNPC